MAPHHIALIILLAAAPMTALACAAPTPEGDPRRVCMGLNDRTFTFDLTKLEATTPECRKAVAANDLSSGAFSLRTELREGGWHVSTLGATPVWYEADVDGARDCHVSWIGSRRASSGTQTSIDGEIDMAARHARIAYSFEKASERCEVLFEGTLADPAR